MSRVYTRATRGRNGAETATTRDQGSLQSRMNPQLPHTILHWRSSIRSPQRSQTWTHSVGGAGGAAFGEFMASASQGAHREVNAEFFATLAPMASLHETTTPTAPPRVFLLSPARCDGERARMLLSPTAASALAVALRSGAGVRLGDVMSFLSGLYFRGKLAYARAFATAPPRREDGVLIITPNRGLRSPDALVTRADLLAAARVDIRSDNRRYRAPLEASVRALARRLGGDGEVVLLGSIASAKYTDVLVAAFGPRLRFPVDFVGRGDMSRGGLMLRCVAAGRELEYVPVVGARVHGPRPPRLTPLPRTTALAPAPASVREPEA
jgi:hypothetical protein